MKKQIWIKLFLLVLLLIPAATVDAQETQPDGPVYVIQPGDTLWGISGIFGVALDDLIAENSISDPGAIRVGDALVIPGFEGVQGVLVNSVVPFGETLSSLSRRYQIPQSVMAKLNRYTSPEEIYAGAPLIVMDTGTGDLIPSGGRAIVKAEQSLLELAISQNTNPWVLIADNDLAGSWDAVPGEILHLSQQEDLGPGALPEGFNIEIAPFPLVQGKTVVLKLQTPLNAQPEGVLVDRALQFFAYEGGFVALHGVHAMQQPGYYPFAVSGYLDDGTPFSFSQKIYVQDGNYNFDSPLVVDSETVDVANTQPEDFEWFSIVEPVTPEKMWQGVFGYPVPDYLRDCYPSFFGNRRSYNGSAYTYFHTGLDFCGKTGVELYAPAPGVVVFADELTVRGNATVLDHGWGVYTAYAHQSEIYVQVGDRVETGQLIGLVGETGRVTGPHLHWEVIINGIQVDPMPWLNQAFP